MLKKYLCLLWLALPLALASCSPSAYLLDLESRAPSESGHSLAGKSMSVVYLESKDGSDSLFNNRVADALALALENEFFDGEEAVKVYNLPKEPDGNYASRDTASTYIMLLDTDVVMMLDTPEFGEKNSRNLIPVVSRLYVYDSMSEDDKVTALTCNTSVSSLNNASRALSVGSSLASPLKSKWKEENFTLIYYDDFDTSWITAIQHADEMEWPDAIEIWMTLSKSRNLGKASSAMYNVAVGCYVLQQYDLALEWLDRSDKTYPVSTSKDLRDRIQAKLVTK